MEKAHPDNRAALDLVLTNEGYCAAFALPSGRSARARRPGERDLAAAERALLPEDRDNAVARGVALLGEIVLLNGRRAAYDYLLGMRLDELAALTRATATAPAPAHTANGEVRGACAATRCLEDFLDLLQAVAPLA